MERVVNSAYWGQYRAGPEARRLRGVDGINLLTKGPCHALSLAAKVRKSLPDDIANAGITGARLHQMGFRKSRKLRRPPARWRPSSKVRRYRGGDPRCDCRWRRCELFAVLYNSGSGMACTVRRASPSLLIKTHFSNGGWRDSLTLGWQHFCQHSQAWGRSRPGQKHLEEDARGNNQDLRFCQGGVTYLFQKLKNTHRFLI